MSDAGLLHIFSQHRCRRAALIVVLTLCPGCGPRTFKPNQWFAHRSSRQLLDTALEDKCPDERRNALRELAQSDDADADWVVKAFDMIARTDADAMVRAEAVRGLGHANSGAVAPTLIKLLKSADGPIPDVKPPAPGPVRWEAVLLLDGLLAQSRLAAADRDAALPVLLARASRDSDRNVQLAAISALRHFPDLTVLPVLVNACRTRDLAFQHRAEATLHALTGQSHDGDPDAWDQSLAATPNPFAAAPHNSAPAPWWSRLVSRDRS